jgi:hypothetical protein
MIAKWTFEALSITNNTYTNAPGIITNLAADVGSGTASGSHVTTTAVYSTPSGYNSPKSLSANNWTVGDYYQFVVSTVGYSNISITFDQTASNTGPSRHNLFYSTNGVAFAQFGSTYTMTNSGWGTGTVLPSSFAFDLSSITSLNNASTVYFRLVQAATNAVAGGTVLGTGTCRVDNFAVLVPGSTAPVLQLNKSGTDVILTWSDPTYSLQAAPLVTGTYTTIPSSTSPYTNAISGSEQYFRLVK